MHRDKPTHNLAGTRLDQPYVGRDLMRHEPSLPRTSTPPPPADEQPELTLVEREIELGSLTHKIAEPDLIFPRFWGVLT
jgi:hypothetical protein